MGTRRWLTTRASGLGPVSLVLVLSVVAAGLMLGATCGAPDEVGRVSSAQPSSGGTGGTGGSSSSSSSGGTGGTAGSTTSVPPVGGSSSPGGTGGSGGLGGTGGGTGGRSSAGGTTASGGTTTSGGRTGSGGTSATGGSRGSTGGTVTGGSTVTGGTSAVGGRGGTVTGGTVTGGTVTGGRGGTVTGGRGGTVTGGTTGTGGVTNPFGGGGSTGGTSTVGGRGGSGGTTGGGGATGGASGGAGGRGGTSGSAGSTATAPTSGLSVYVTEAVSGATGSISLRLRIDNKTTSTVDMSTVTLRYWYKDDGLGTALTFAGDYVSIGYSNTGTMTGKAVAATPAATDADHYLELSFTGTLAAQGDKSTNDQFNVRVTAHTASYAGAVDVTNDYSYSAGALGYNSKITLHDKSGKVIWGTAP